MSDEKKPPGDEPPFPYNDWRIHNARMRDPVYRAMIFEAVEAEIGPECEHEWFECQAHPNHEICTRCERKRRIS
jgi:hypothetical protein